MANLVGGVVTWDLDADISRLKSKLSSARDSVEETARSLDSRFKKSLNVAEGSAKALGGVLALAATGVAAIGIAGVKTAEQLESARGGFIALLKSADQADAVIARIKKEAATTPFEITGLVEGTQALTAITKDGDKAIDILLDVGKAVATSGKGQFELDRVVQNLQQISATGKLTAQDLIQFQGAIPIFNDIIAAAGLTATELQNSENAAELLFDAFEKAGEAGGITAEGFSAQAGTFNQLVSNLKDSVSILSADLVTQSGLFDLVKDSIGSLTDFINNNKDTITELGTSFVEAGKNIVEFVKNNKTLLGAVAGLVGVFTTVFSLIGAVSLIFKAVGFVVAAVASPVGAIAAVITLLIATGFLLVKNWDKIKKSASDVWESVSEAFTDAWTAISDTVTRLGDSLTDSIRNTWEGLRTFFSNTLSAIVDVFRLVFSLEGIGFIVGFMAGLFARILDNVIDFVGNALSTFVDFVANAGEAFGEFSKSVGPALSDFFKNLFTETIPKFINDFSSFIVDKFGDIIRGITTFVREAPSKLINLGIELWNSVKGGLEEFSTNALEWAKKLSEDLIDYFKDLPGNIKDAIVGGVGRFTEGAKSGFKKALGIDGIDALATGVRNFGGGLAVVGERGPEIVNLPRGSDVIPNKDIGQGLVINNTNNFSNPSDPNAFARLLAFEIRTS